MVCAVLAASSQAGTNCSAAVAEFRRGDNSGVTVRRGCVPTTGSCWAENRCRCGVRRRSTDEGGGGNCGLLLLLLLLLAVVVPARADEEDADDGDAVG